MPLADHTQVYQMGLAVSPHLTPASGDVAPRSSNLTLAVMVAAFHRPGCMTEHLTEEFVAKVDAFAASLEPEEQALLADLLADGDDVVGFNDWGGGNNWQWPGLVSLGVWKAPAGTEAASISQPTQNQRLDGDIKGS